MKLLIAEDEIDLAEALTAFFEKNQFTVEAVYNGADAYDYARELEPGNETNYFDRFWDNLEDLLDFDVTSISFPQWVWWCLGAMAVMAVGYFLWKQQATLFGPKDVGLTAEEITEEDIKASFKHGVLNLTIPKKEAPKIPEKKLIAIEG